MKPLEPQDIARIKRYCESSPYKAFWDKELRSVHILKELDIPIQIDRDLDDTTWVNTTDLVDILTDEDKLKALISKIRMRAFW